MHAVEWENMFKKQLRGISLSRYKRPDGRSHSAY